MNKLTNLIYKVIPDTQVNNLLMGSLAVLMGSGMARAYCAFTHEQQEAKSLFSREVGLNTLMVISFLILVAAIIKGNKMTSDVVGGYMRLQRNDAHFGTSEPTEIEPPR